MIIYIADFFTGIIEAMMMFMLYNTFCVKKDFIPNWVYNVGIIVGNVNKSAVEIYPKFLKLL